MSRDVLLSRFFFALDRCLHICPGWQPLLTPFSRGITDAFCKEMRYYCQQQQQRQRNKPNLLQRLSNHNTNNRERDNSCDKIRCFIVTCGFAITLFFTLFIRFFEGGCLGFFFFFYIEKVRLSGKYRVAHFFNNNNFAPLTQSTARRLS